MTTISISKLSTEDLADIQSYVDRVRGYLKTSTAAWLNIAAEFSSAKNKLKRPAYQQFITDCGFTTAVADKLVSIGKCAILHDEKNLAVLSSAEGWTVLYELSKLPSQKSSSLLEAVANGSQKKLTRELIYNYANGNPLDQKRLVVASIEIDDAKLKLISLEQFNAVKSRIDALKNEIDRINAGFILKSRENNVVKIGDRARANNDAMIVRTAA